MLKQQISTKIHCLYKEKTKPARRRSQIFFVLVNVEKMENIRMLDQLHNGDFSFNLKSFAMANVACHCFVL